MDTNDTGCDLKNLLVRLHLPKSAQRDVLRREADINTAVQDDRRRLVEGESRVIAHGKLKSLSDTIFTGMAGSTGMAGLLSAAAESLDKLDLPVADNERGLIALHETHERELDAAEWQREIDVRFARFAAPNWPPTGWPASHLASIW